MMITADDSPWLIAAAQRQARKDGHCGAIAVVPLVVGKEPELGQAVEVRRQGARTVSRPRQRLPHAAAFAGLCEVTLACLPSAGEPSARATAVYAAVLARGIGVSRRQLSSVLARLIDEGRVERLGRREINATYRSTSP